MANHRVGFLLGLLGTRRMKYLLLALVTIGVLTATATAGEQYTPLVVTPLGTPTVTLQNTTSQTEIQGEVVRLQQ